ncbi:uncharacterized protein LOC110724351 [Chenopodium quinoa]|uniref:uncharacterized protein LOC110724351 n=1 Tax=Chenopodium quinoa TaxID=63459 RepID=UPI000B788BA9|nr:uncharacterized protein LOC110724351 [Chenopodium quinoa]
MDLKEGYGFGVDRVAAIENGVFLVRFRMEEGRERVLVARHIFFDRKPVVAKRWEPGIKLRDEGVQEVPVWIRLPRLDLKFWGQSSLMNLAGAVGKPVQIDRATATKELMAYARIMVQINVNEEMIEEIEFLDENGKVMHQKVIYEWKPVIFSTCSGMGHDSSQCPNHKVQARILQEKRNLEQKGDEVNMEELKEINVEKNEYNKSNSLGMVVSDRVLYHQMGLFSLLETKVKSENFGRVFANFGSDWSVAANYSKHCAGRIWIIWNPRGMTGLLCGQISTIAEKVKGPWIVSGDYNNVLNPEDRVSLACTLDEVEDFRSCLRLNGLIDFKTGGLFYTWNNKQDGENKFCSKIDRVVVNGEWVDYFNHFSLISYQRDLWITAHVV